LAEGPPDAERGATMRWALMAVALGACATAPVVTDQPAAGEPVEVSGHVVSACGPEPLPREPVAIRAAGELEVLDSTETDASGAFSFRVAPPAGDVVAPLVIEARGVRTVAKQARRGLVAELVLPCTGG
jgi:hypothetical protein